MDELITKSKEEKLGKFYPVKTSQMPDQVKAIDLSKRIVQFVANTYLYADDGLDVLVPGCAVKTLNDKGPQSKAVAKIKHIADHRMSTENLVGIPIVADEREIDGKKVLYVESEIIKSNKGNDHLINYQSGAYDNHSIGFRYRDLGMADKNSNDEDQRQRYDEFYPQLINPEKVDKYEFFWVVKEIELFEFSTVLFGMNSLTGVVGIKGQTKESALLNLFTRMDLLEKQLRTGKQTDETMQEFELQSLQIKQIMTDLMNQEPSKKGTHEPPKHDTLDAIKVLEGFEFIKIKV